MGNENRIEVEIFNQKFTLYSEVEGKERLKKLAAQVDERMREIYKNTRLSSAIKIAILTALNLADELALLKERAGGGNENSELVGRILSVVEKIEKLMQDSAGES